MDSGEKKQNLDLKNEEVKKSNQDQGKKAEVKIFSDPKAGISSEEQKPANKSPSKLPVKIIVPAAIIIVAIILIVIFLIHSTGKTAINTVSYTPVNYLSASAINSIMGGNWSLVYNQTANSTVINNETAYFPQGTVAASVQEFIPSSEIPQALKNKSNNITIFLSKTFYINSSSEANYIFAGAERSLASANTSRFKFNVTVVGNSSMVYINDKQNLSNSSLGDSTSLYLLNGKSLVVVSSFNKNISYQQAKRIVSYMFS